MIPVLRDTRSQEQTQEVKLPERYPDVGRILGTWGQCLLRSKDWRGSSLGISGGVMTWTFYLPEDGTEPVCVEAWIPFQIKWEIPETQREGMIRTACTLSNAEARTVSARRMLIRTDVTVWLEALEPGEREIPLPGDTREDIPMLRQTFLLRIPKEAGEKTFSVEEEFPFPGNGEKIEKILTYQIFPNLLEKKIVGERLVFRGNALLHVVYQNQTGKMAVWESELPFSQLTELEKEYGPEGEPDILCAVTNLDLELGEEKMLLKCGMTAQYLVRGRETVEVVQDAYSPRRSVKLTGGELNLPTVLDQWQELHNMELELTGNAGAPVDAVLFLDKPELFREENGIQMDLHGTVQVLHYDREEQLQCVRQKFSERIEIPASADAELQMLLSQSVVPEISLTGTGVRAKNTVTMDMIAYSTRGIPMVTGLHMGEEEELNPNRPTLILRRAGDETLWDMAKRCGSTVEAIRTANQIQSEPESGQVLLIPIS